MLLCKYYVGEDVSQFSCGTFKLTFSSSLHSLFHAPIQYTNKNNLQKQEFIVITQTAAKNMLQKKARTLEKKRICFKRKQKRR